MNAAALPQGKKQPRQLRQSLQLPYTGVRGTVGLSPKSSRGREL